MRFSLQHQGYPTYGGGWKETTDWTCWIIIKEHSLYGLGKGAYRSTAIRRAVFSLLRKALENMEQKIG